MAGLIVTSQQELRPCKVKGKNALFHRWEQYATVIEPSIRTGGHLGGQIAEVCGIVEDENGNVIRCKATDIRFIDEKHRDYCFEEVQND